jgi:hypothetical protein
VVRVRRTFVEFDKGRCMEKYKELRLVLGGCLSNSTRVNARKSMCDVA